MSEFHDPELRQQLGRLSGPYPDDNAAFAAWQRRVGHARRRRAVAWTSGAAMSLVMTTVGVAALQNPGGQSVVPGRSSETSEELTVSTATTETDESSTTESTALASMAPAVTPSTAALDTTPSTAVAVETSPPESEATGAAGSQPKANSSNGSGDGSPTTPEPQTSASNRAPQTVTKTVNSVGGTVTVRHDGDELTVTDVIPATGFQAIESDRSANRVVVTFRSADHMSEISVSLSGGAIKADVFEKSESNEEAVTSDSSGGDHESGDSEG